MTKDIEELFEDKADEAGFCLDKKWGDYKNPYLDSNTSLAFDFFRSGFLTAENFEKQKLEGCVVVAESEYNEMAQFKDLYKRAIVNAKKRKDQLNWAHVAGLGVGSTKAIALLKEFGIDPSAKNMYAMLEAARGGNEH